MLSVVRRALALLVAGGLVVGLTAQAPAASAAPRGWPVGPAAFGIMGGQVDPQALGAVRTWDTRANWCDIQPTPDADMVANLDQLLAPRLDSAVSLGATSALISLGHPAPWVFENHPRAVKRAKVWSCGLHAAGISIPRSSSIRPGSAQYQRFATYASTVIGYATARYAGRLALSFQVYNEPNLSSGLDPRLRIPGAASTAADAARAVYAYEGIVRDLIRGPFGAHGLQLASTALYQRSSAFSKAYLRLHGRSPRVDLLAFNIYGWTAKTPNGMVAEWNRKAVIVTKQIKRHSKLRRLPAVITETNHNLVNRNRDRSNLKRVIGLDATQRRLATATQMDAFYHGFSQVFWLGPWRHQQAAVRINDAGGPARTALATLRAALDGTRIQGCSSRSGTRTCSFVAADGAKVRVHWRLSGSRKIRVTSGGTVTEMTGAQRLVQAGAKLTVGTTPVVLRAS